MNEENRMNNSVNTRALLLDMLQEITTQKEYSHVVVRNVLNKYNYLNVLDKSFIKRVCEGTLERQIQIDYIINSFSKVKVNKMKPVICIIMRMAVYQIMFMDSIPDSAACNEAVKLAQKRGFGQLKGFVNGVLRNIARGKDTITYPSKEKEPVLAYSILYSMPEWIVKRWLDEFGVETTEIMLEDLLAEHPIVVRMDENLSEEQQNSLVKEISDKGIVIKRHPYLSYAYQLRKTEGMTQVPGFMEGKINVQDVSSMLAVEIAQIQKGYEIIDVCAAPGGKTIHLACKLNHTGHIEARDLSEYKTSMMDENKQRNPYQNITIKVWDATIDCESSHESADVVLVDAPCSGLGVIGKKRDIKYHVTEESLEELALLQQTILKTVQQYVKPGGILIYSTCTINKRENEENVKWFTDHFPFKLKSLTPMLPDALKGGTAEEGYLQLLPGLSNTDGFFMARLCKNK